jgi:hypothetical protein
MQSAERHGNLAGEYSDKGHTKLQLIISRAIQTTRLRFGMTS